MASAHVERSGASEPVLTGRPDVRCPSCLSGGMQEFYKVEGIPANSCLLLNDAEQARAYPKRDLVLGFCPACGFICNIIFQPEAAVYRAGYEETQGFSQHFAGYLEDLARRMIARWDLHGRDVLEIGCGKGRFVALLCELGGNRGIGIDPAYDPARQDAAPGGSLRFIRDFYGDKYAHLKADFVCCRHTLEHIPQTRQFVSTAMRGIGGRRDVVVFFDVPDTLRVLREAAFWDIYYEHCSYFSPGSLARLFRDLGLDVIDLQLDYDDQYILLAGRPATGPALPRAELALADDLEQIRSAVTEFAAACPEKIRHWRDRLDELARRGRRAAIWGSGSKCVAFLSSVGGAPAVGSIVDVNPHRHGKFLPGSGRRIDPPRLLVEYRPDVVIVMNPVYCDEIRKDLGKMGVSAEMWSL